MNRLGDYLVGDELYRGRSSLVYRGQRESDGEPVVLKLLRYPQPTPEQIARFRLEYEITHSLATGRNAGPAAAGAVRAAAELGVWMVNVHAGGGRRMMEAAAEALWKIRETLGLDNLRGVHDAGAGSGSRPRRRARARGTASRLAPRADPPRPV